MTHKYAFNIFPGVAKASTLRLAAVLLAALSWGLSYGQGGGYKPYSFHNSVEVPPSPTAASLGKYGEVPVGHFTGSVSLSVPLHEVRVQGFSLPIALSYGYAGLRVDETAPWVGLGWSLSAGGAITRVMRGKPDEHLNGYRNIPRPIPDPSTPEFGDFNGSLTDYERRRFADGFWDGIPDKYLFSFAGRTGQLVLTRDSIYTLPYMPLHITRPDLDTWLITDESGVTFQFGKQTEGGVVIRDGTERTDYMNSCSAPAEELYSYSSAWHLVKVTTPGGQTVTFDYELELISTVPTVSYTYDISSFGSGACPKLGLSACQGSGEPVQSKRLKQITFPLGRVEFHALTRRLDLEVFDNALALDSIVVKNVAGELVRSFGLGYSYLGTSGRNSRLLLRRVREHGAGGTRKAPYFFSYAEGNAIPAQGSFSQDHWGFYNRKANSTLLPRNEHYPAGADRSPDYKSALLGALTEVTYPTGGHTSFGYEPHEYGYVRNQPFTEYEQKVSRVVVNARRDSQTEPGETKSEPFTIEEQQWVQLTFSIDGNASNQPGEPMPALENYVAILSSDGQEKYRRDWGNTIDGISIRDSVLLSPGSYMAKAVALDAFFWSHLEVSTYVTDYNSPIYNKEAGGIRIRRTVSSSGGGNEPQVTEYLYEDFDGTGRSSGSLNATPEYAYSQIDVRIDDITGRHIECPKRFLTSGSRAALASSWGAVTYPEVTVLNGQGGSGGRTTFKYTPGGEVGDVGPPFLPALSRSHLSGLLLEQTEYDAAGRPVKRSTRHYTRNNSEGAPNRHGVGVYGNAYVANYDEQFNLLDRFTHSLYGIFTDWVYLNSQTDTLYFYTGGALSGTVAMVDSFHYDNPGHAMLTRTSRQDSRGQTVVSVTTYPSDYANASGPLADLKAAHVLTPVEQVTYEESGDGLRILHGQVVTYKPGGQGLTDEVWRLENGGSVALQDFKFSHRAAGSSPNAGAPADFGSDGRYGRKLAIELYDTRFNPIQVTGRDGIKTSYVWGYGQALLLAEVRNASRAEIDQAVSSNSILFEDAQGNALPDAQLRAELGRLREALPGAQVTTYTHEPLVGVTSVTDPNGKTTYYEYDGLGRLKAVRDHEGNLLKTHKYHYAGQ